MRQIESRLLRLERQPENKLPIVVVWDKKHDGSVETEIAAIRKERGEKVEICVVRKSNHALAVARTCRGA